MHFIETVLSDSAGHSHSHHHPNSDSSRAMPDYASAAVSISTVKVATEAIAAVEVPCAPEHHHHATTTACETDDARIVSSSKLVNLVLVELGFSIHSVFVGLAVANSAEEDFHGLLVAICFHQFFEGLALSARLTASGLGWRRDAIFAAIFSLSGPLGIAIGLFAVSASASLNSGTYLVTQGVLDSIGAGIMLYLGFSMLLVDFPVDVAALCDHGPAGSDKQRTATLMRAGMFGALWAGVCGMAVLGKFL
jgi:zinc transporter 1/2/3